MYGLYVITDENLSDGMPHAEIARLACEGGADVIQLRGKNMNKAELLRAAKEIRKITSHHGALFFVNDHIDIAIASEADGVHLGQDDMSLENAMRITQMTMMIGISVSTLEEARAAERGGADYIGFGPIFETSSKHDAGSAVGLKFLRLMKNSVNIPVVAIGGITKENIADVILSGADGAAVISAVVSQKDIRKAAEELKTIILNVKVKASTGRR
jgi:thiamine-phosphate pyrophosphorylase